MVTEAASALHVAVRERSLGLSLRRWFLIAAPILAGLFAILGAAADPAVGQDGRVLYEKYAANPDPLQWKSLGFHWSYAFWTMAAFVLAAHVRRRGVWIANGALVLAFVGATTLPGLLFVDFYDSAIGQVGGADLTVRVNERLESMWGIPVFVVPGLIGFVLSLPVAALAAWRAGIVGWWSAAAVVGGIAAFMLSSVAVWGTLLMTLLFAVFAFALARSEELGA
jgi:hypothetical protein